MIRNRLSAGLWLLPAALSVWQVIHYTDHRWANAAFGVLFAAIALDQYATPAGETEKPRALWRDLALASALAVAFVVTVVWRL